MHISCTEYVGVNKEVQCLCKLRIIEGHYQREYRLSGKLVLAEKLDTCAGLAMRNTMKTKVRT